MTTMTRAKVGAGVLLLLFILGAGVNSAPQENAQKPAICTTIDSAVKGISGYNMKDQAALADGPQQARRQDRRAAGDGRLRRPVVADVRRGLLRQLP
jgi:hypothetical protein